MAVPPIASLLVGSSQADVMKDWYQRAFGVTANEMGAFDFGGFQLFIEAHTDVSGPTKEPARVIINMNVDDCRALESHLKTQSVRWVREVEQMPFGLIGTLADPDGNYLQIIQWGAPEAHRDV
ncbi:MAG TPA: VOC family protein [Candidatus Dormibacteraeota bacterium]